jgi:ribosomal protein L7/L12
MNDTAKRIMEIRQQIDALKVELAQLTGHVSSDVDAKCRALLSAGQKVEAVKTYRIAMGNTACSLKEAVDYVNSLSYLPNVH